MIKSRSKFKVRHFPATLCQDIQKIPWFFLIFYLFSWNIPLHVFLYQWQSHVLINKFDVFFFWYLFWLILIHNFQSSCQNYIRVLVTPTPGRLMVCGTNSFRPMCHTYEITANNYTRVLEKPGQALCPYDPHHNSTAVFVGKWKSTN